jgi:hypothetical protein
MPSASVIENEGAMMESGKGLSSAAVLLTLVCFFLPWITVSCNGSPMITVTGYDMAAGVDLGELGGRTDSDPLLFVIPAVALIAGWFLLANGSPRGRGTIQFLGGVAGLVILGLKWFALQDNESSVDPELVRVDIEYGAWGTIIGLALLILTGLSVSGGRSSLRESPWARASPYPKRASRAKPRPTAARAPPVAESPAETSRAKVAVSSPVAPAQPRVVPEAGTEPPAKETRSCPGCGKSLDAKYAFCIFCGQKL